MDPVQISIGSFQMQATSLIMYKVQEVKKFTGLFLKFISTLMELLNANQHPASLLMLNLFIRINCT
jgi:hypothetical protein